MILFNQFGGGGSVVSVTGNVVDNTDPANPIVTANGNVFIGYLRKVLTVAESTTLFSSPLKIIDGNAGLSIQILGASARLQYTGVPYSFFSLMFQSQASAKPQWQLDGMTTNAANGFQISAAAIWNNNIVANDNIVLTSDADDVNGSTSPITIYVWYAIFET